MPLPLIGFLIVAIVGGCRKEVPPAREPLGILVFEASVTKDGDVTSVRTLSNTTGDSGIESQNRVQLSNAKFYPLLVNGRPQPFVYEYRVAY